jgi:2-C-methyl-D-erythritol 2,4-cyclodiphosphate synthase
MRVGIGYDVHRFEKGRKLVIGGIEVPSEKGLSGHSDADVLSHAVADALLGAAGLGNIGTRFPNDDPSLKNISSLELLKRVNALLQKEQWAVVNVDSTVSLESPRISPFILRMRAGIAEALGIHEECISVKATTGEGLGFIGSGEGAAAHAVALIEKSSGGS